MTQPPASTAGPPRGPLPPVALLPDFLAEAEHQRLLDWVAESERAFQPSLTVEHRAGRDGPGVDPRHRVSLSSWELGEWRGLFEQRIGEALPRIVAEVGLGGPPPTALELEFTAYGEGAFFRPHLDIPVGGDRLPLGYGANDDRVLSAVYYFHRRPRGFAGGELRLFRMGVDGQDPKLEPGDFADLPASDNRLVVFPSWAMHEVRPVSVPSGNFADYRYAINCWLCRGAG